MAYRIYNPTVTETVAVDPYDNPAHLTYVSNSSLAFWRGRYWAVMDGTTQGFIEGSAGQSIWLTTSTDTVAWTGPVQPFRNPNYCVNPISGTYLEWQPNLVVVDDELWCTWSGADGYVSKLSDPDGLWTTYRFEFSGTDVSISTTVQGAATGGRALRPTIDGWSDWLPYAASNPIVLSSGVVACPFTLLSSHLSTQTPASSAFVRAVKHNALLKCEGGTWSMTLIDTSAFGDFCPWEPFIVENPAGHVTVFSRNLDSRVDDDDFLLAATSVDGGETFSPSVSAKMLVPSSRGFARQVSDKRWVMTHLDQAQGSNNTVDQELSAHRFNGSVFVSRRGGDDFVAGVNFSGHDNCANYPQFIVGPTGDLLINYTSGSGNAFDKVRRSLRIVRLDALDDDNHYVHPRSTLRFVGGPYDPPIAGSPPYYSFSGHDRIWSTTSVTATTGATYVAWLRRDANADVVMDCRTLDSTGQVLRVTGLSLPGVNFLHGFTIGLKPVMLAAVVDNNSADTITFYLGDGGPAFLTSTCYYRSILFSGQPSNNDTIRIDGVLYTFKTSASASRDVAIGVDVATTITNLRTKLLTDSMQALAFPTRLVMTRSDSGTPGDPADPLAVRPSFAVVSGSANITVETGMPLSGGPLSVGMKAQSVSALAPYVGRLYEARVYASALTANNLRALYNSKASSFDYPAMSGTATAPSSPLLLLDPSVHDSEEFPSISQPARCEVVDDTLLRIHGEGSAGIELPYGATKLTIRYKLGATPTSTDKYTVATFGTSDNPVKLHISAAHPAALYANDRFVGSLATPTGWNTVIVTVSTNKIRVGAFEHVFSGKPRAHLGNAYPEGLLAVSKSVDFDVSGMGAVQARGEG